MALKKGLKIKNQWSNSSIIPISYKMLGPSLFILVNLSYIELSTSFTLYLFYRIKYLKKKEFFPEPESESLASVVP